MSDSIQTVNWDPAVATWYVDADCAADAINSGPCKIGDALVCTRIDAKPIWGGRWQLTATLAHKSDTLARLERLMCELKDAIKKAKN